MTPPASEAVERYWLRQVVAEYRSSALAQELTLGLTRLGASPDLIESGLRIASDELEHARLCDAVYRAAGGSGPVPLERATLAIDMANDERLEEKVLDAAVTIFCLGETVAVPLFRHLRAGCEEPVALSAFDRIVRDEPRHGSFGWDLLEWLLDGPCAGHEQRVITALHRGFGALEQAYGISGAKSESSFTDPDRSWGLAPRGEYAAVLDSAFARIWEPRFAAYDIDAEPAWNARFTNAQANAN